ncbi:hypothetical protein FSP39_011529 [Pinctada imbricata]|uniref:C1q domain-containing protein n=1 Tax=Pinctada imbricata TaxID=66713 RepID=A0AA88XNB9_PINIB|nr:hypothetical protein FSP39_011529 [Pinctada imbricata]
MYLISTSVMSTPGHHIFCDIVKNGKTISKLYGGTEDYQGDTQTFVIVLQSGDMVWVRHLAGSTNELLSGYNSYLSGFLISTL